MEFEVIKYITQHGLEKTISDFSLKSIDYGHKILLKYSQIDSPMSRPEVQECRGLVLDKDFNVMSLGFKKFFNIEEPNAKDISINWDSAHVLEKVDGTFIQIYHDYLKNEWCIGTTGTAEAEGEVGTTSNLTFKTLFLNTLLKYYKEDEFFDILEKGKCYMFELCTPWNIVVKQHSESTLTFLGVRNISDMSEVEYNDLPELKIPKVKRYSFKSLSEVTDTFNNLPYSEEGYVVVDESGELFKRVKIKNPAYVAVHHTKFATAKHYILDIIKTNEVDEFVSVFKDREVEIKELQNKYNKLIELLENQLKKLMIEFPTLLKENQYNNFFYTRVDKICEELGISDKSFLYRYIKEGESKINRYKDNHDLLRKAVKMINGHFPPATDKEFDRKFALSVISLNKLHSGFFFGFRNGQYLTVKEYIEQYDTKKLYEILTR